MRFDFKIIVYFFDQARYLDSLVFRINICNGLMRKFPQTEYAFKQFCNTSDEQVAIAAPTMPIDGINKIFNVKFANVATVALLRTVFSKLLIIKMVATDPVAALKNWPKERMIST